MKIVPHHPPLVPILIVHEAKSETKRQNTEVRLKVAARLVLLLIPIRGTPKSITAARQIVLRVMCDTPVIVRTQATGLIEVAPYVDVAKYHT